MIGTKLLLSPIAAFLLHGNAFRTEKCRSHLSAISQQNVLRHIEVSMDIYIDDMLVKSLIDATHITHLKECFHTLNEYSNKLNLAKCMFTVTSGEFLGYIFTQRGIEANQNKNLNYPRFSKNRRSTKSPVLPSFKPLLGE